MIYAAYVTDAMALVIIGMLYASGRRDKGMGMGQVIFQRMLLCVSFTLVVDMIGWGLDGLTFYGSLPLQKAVNTMLWAGQISFTLLWLQYVRIWLQPDRYRPFTLVSYLPLMVFAVLLCVNWFTGWIFSFDDAHFYQRGPYYLPCALLFGAYSAVAFIMTIHRYFTVREKAAKKDCLWMSGFMVIPYLCVMIQMFVYGASLVVPAYTLSFLMIYLNIHQRRMVAERLKVLEQAADLQRANVSIMLSQIQPHFLYNALCVIQDLCHGKAPEAEEATIAFSRFLRGNLDSLKADKPIPFSQELAHTRYYLTLEQMRFGERLRVAYDIRAELFRLPALTLQPIVENAVRYGVMKQLGGGVVRISTDETYTHYHITVTDNGVGFDPLEKHEDGRTHIGISNVRQRLKEMCGGELLIDSVPGAGTTVTILLPKGGESLEDSCGGR